MPHIDYQLIIMESEEEFKKLEKRHRYSHLFHRVRMLKLLKSAECSSLGEAAEALGYQSPSVPEVAHHLQARGLGGAFAEPGTSACS